MQHLLVRVATRRRQHLRHNLPTAAIAQAKLAYQMFTKTFSGPRWSKLAQLGAQVQRPLWASTSTKNPKYSDTLYVDELIGPNTVNTLPDNTMAAFSDHGNLGLTITQNLDQAHSQWRQFHTATEQHRFRWLLAIGQCRCRPER